MDASTRHAAQAPQERTPLETGAPVTREISGGETHRYQVRLAEGQCAAITATQTAADVVLEQIGPDGAVVQAVDDEVGIGSAETLAIVADTEGVYDVAVRPTLNKAPTGRYQISLAEVRGATEKDRSLQEVSRLRTESERLVNAHREKDALASAERALTLAERTTGPGDVLVALVAMELGAIQRTRAHYSAAQRTLERSVGLLKQKRGADDIQTAKAERVLGSVYAAINEFTRAEPLLIHALQATEKALGPEHPLVGPMLRSLGLMYSDRGDMLGALRMYERAVAITEKWLGRDHMDYAQLQNNLGVLHLRQRDWDRAAEYLERALAIHEKLRGTDHVSLATVLQNLGMTARERKEYTAAERYYSRALALRERELGAEHPLLAWTLNNIGNLHAAQGNYTKSLEIHLRALSILEKHATRWNPPMLSLGSIARTYAALGDFENAVRYQERVDAAVEVDLALNLTVGSERQKLAYIADAADRTSRTISLNVQLQPENQTAARLAAVALFQRKARVLDAVADISGALKVRAAPADRALLDRLSETTARLAQLALNGPGNTSAEEHRKTVEELDERKEELEAEMSRRSDEFRVNAETVTLEAVQAVIPADAALLEFAVYRPFDPKSPTTATAYGEPRYAVYVLRRDGDPIGRDIGPASVVDEAIARFREALQDPRRKDVATIARTLESRLMQPLRALTGNATRLLISPDGELALIPFEALLDDGGRHLVERYSISYLTSGRDLLRMRARRDSKSDPLIVAAPSFGEPAEHSATASHTNGPIDRRGERRRSITTGRDLSTVYFAPLTGTLQEARNIRAIFADARILTGLRATESAIKAANAPRILHIATHGFFLHNTGTPGPAATAPAASASRSSPENPGNRNPLLRSGLALAGANLNPTSREDGILTALEASHLNLWGTKLVTLSACDTGVGIVKYGDGVYGLRRSVFLAGAETLVMSLWPVSDFVTREMMTSYYRGLKKGLGRGDALRQVQLSMLKRQGRQHPFYWASFIQAGDWANLEGQR